VANELVRIRKASFCYGNIAFRENVVKRVWTGGKPIALYFYKGRIPKQISNLEVGVANLLTVKPLGNCAVARFPRRLNVAGMHLIDRQIVVKV
jgi:hypothetical protein